MTGAEVALLTGIFSSFTSALGANQSANNQNAIINAQNEQALQNWTFQSNDRADMYNYEQSVVRVQRENERRAREYQDAVALQNWNQQVQINADDYAAAQTAYDQSIIDFDNQIDINQQSQDLALAETQQKLFDQETALGFQRQEELSQQLAQYNQLTTQLSSAQNSIDDALMRETIAETQALRDRDQALDRANYGLERLDTQAAETKTMGDLQEKALQSRIDSARTSRDEALMLLDQQNDTARLQTAQAIEKNQQQTSQEIARQQLGLSQTVENLQGDFADKKLQTDQLIDKLTVQNIGDELSIRQKSELINDAFEDTKLSTKQKIDALTDEQRYNLFNRDSKVGELDGQLESARLQYQQQRAAQSFQQEANNIEKLINEGQVSAQGRKGASAARSINVILAAAGRQSAQLTDAILRGDTAFADTESNIARQKRDTLRQFGLASGTISRKKRDERALLRRSQTKKNLQLKQLRQEKAQVDRLFSLDKDQASETLKQEKKNLNRRSSQAKDSTQLAIQQATDSSSLFSQQMSDSYALQELQNKERAFYENKKFEDAFASLSIEQDMLAESLTQQLSAFSHESGVLNQQIDHARENYNVAYQAAQEIHDAELRRYDTTAEAVRMERERLDTQGTMIEDQYQASLESATQAQLASDARINLDRYSADITADKMVLPEPVQAPDPPAPIALPRTIYMDPRQPLDLPEPVAMAGVSANYFPAAGSLVQSVGGFVEAIS